MVIGYRLFSYLILVGVSSGELEVGKPKATLHLKSYSHVINAAFPTVLSTVHIPLRRPVVGDHPGQGTPLFPGRQRQLDGHNITQGLFPLLLPLLAIRPYHTTPS